MLKIKQKPHHRVIHHGKRLSPVIRIVRNVFVVTFILGGVLIGGATAFTWYNSANGEQPKIAAVTPRVPVKTKAPVKHSQTARISASIQMLTSPVSPGENATISVRTNPDVDCVIKVEYGNVAAIDSGLLPKKSDEYGMVTWGWSVPASAPTGKWPVTVLCSYLKNSGQVVGDLVIVKKGAVQ